jgi:acyl-CoA synthetase (AMP-forming)/AMP-acid ligase II
VQPLDAPLPAAAQDIAFIQYTSGSTMDPRGIVITHGNIMANQAMIRRAFAHDEATVVMSWLPLHHDMGLIGSILQPLYLGGRCILASPLAFLQRPVRWLRAVADHRATTSGAPNFAYELCARQVTAAQMEGLDLSGWRLAFCGSEPVRPGTMRRFAARFAPAGFDAAALYPCYGMAEATLFVTGGIAGQGARSRDIPRSRFADVAADAAEMQAVTDCGRPTPPARIAILDPQTGRAAAGEAVGEICVAGPHVSPGLWSPDRPGGIRPHGDRMVDLDGVAHLRSGDAGLLIEGTLHIVGRLKDMVILRGANVHAEDIEHTLMEQPEAAPLEAAAAVAVERDAAEVLVLLCELSAQGPRGGLPAETADALRRRVAEAHGLMPAEMVLLAPRSLPRTTSGKVQRQRARAEWLAGRLKPSRWLPA